MSRPSAPRPKRAADLYTRTQPDAPSSKKPRFDARNPSTLAPDAPSDTDDEAEILELDEIGRPGGVKRNAVNIDGYESDSDNDNFDARAREKVRREKAAEEQEEDMFADLQDKDGDEDEEVVGGKGGKKDVRFLDVDEIEGQVSSSKGGGHVSADFRAAASGKGKRKEESESESDDDEAAEEEDVDPELGAGALKHHAPALDAFNMRAEAEEGRFDETGNFVRKAVDPDSVHDNWLEGVSRKEMKRAKEAQARREEEQRQKERKQDEVLTSELVGALIGALEVGETVLEGLQRLGKSKRQGKAKTRTKKARSNGQHNGDDMDVDSEQPTAEELAERKRKETVEAITEAADQLMSRGDLEIYDREREWLMRLYRRETGDDWVDTSKQEAQSDAAAATTSGDGTWEYRWVDGRDGSAVNGPYDGSMMKAWGEAGYFPAGQVEVKRAGEGENWTSIETVQF